MKNLIDKFRIFFHGRKILWNNHIKIFCDGGYPTFKIIPHLCKNHFDPYWGLKGFIICWLGREFHFVFGKDRKGLYD